jgi:hypothetical protein
MINIDAHKLVGCVTMFVWVYIWGSLGMFISIVVPKDAYLPDLQKVFWFFGGWLFGIGSWFLIARFLLKKDLPQDNWREIEDDWSEIDE